MLSPKNPPSPQTFKTLNAPEAPNTMNAPEAPNTMNTPEAPIVNVSETETEYCQCIHISDYAARQIRQRLPEENILFDLADFFKVFADSTRIKMLYVLLCSEMCVCDLAEMINMNQSAISHQLRTLKQMNLVKSRREGKTIFYSLADDHIKTILSQGIDHVVELKKRLYQSYQEEAFERDSIDN